MRRTPSTPHDGRQADPYVLSARLAGRNVWARPIEAATRGTPYTMTGLVAANVVVEGPRPVETNGGLLALWLGRRRGRLHLGATTGASTRETLRPPSVGRPVVRERPLTASR